MTLEDLQKEGWIHASVYETCLAVSPNDQDTYQYTVKFDDGIEVTSTKVPDRD